jgi:hypothetical protein
LLKKARNDAIRELRDHGSGKSSFNKSLQQPVRRKGQSVLFILYTFDPQMTMLMQFISVSVYDSFSPSYPLEQDKAESRLLIIFDGLR